MSWVANVLLSVAVQEDRELVDAFDRWLREDAPWNGPSVPPGSSGVGYLRNLAQSPDAWGGWKAPEASLFAGATNHADVDAIVARFAAIPWRHPNVAQLFIKDQEQEFFRLWMIVSGEPSQLTPRPPPGLTISNSDSNARRDNSTGVLAWRGRPIMRPRTVRCGVAQPRHRASPG